MPEPKGEAGNTMDDSGVTYFVDDDGRYFFQNSAEGDSGTVAQDADSAVPQEEEEPQPQPMENLIEPDTDDRVFMQTGTLVPSENSDEQVTYVVIIAEDNKEVVNLNINMDIDQNEKQEGDAEREEKPSDKLENDEKITEEEKEEDKMKKQKPNSSHKLFPCTLCKYNTNKRYLLVRHMKCHSEERPHMCYFCERGFKTQVALQNHLNVHNGVQPLSCSYCKNTFTTSGELVRHVRYKHTREKPHKCSECDYACVELSTLRRHARCHSGERPYHCQHCTYASSDSFKLKRHLRTHTGEKPYKCEQCKLCFTQSHSLKSHKLLHNVEEKPGYVCKLCPAKYSRMTALRIHVQKQHTSKTSLKCKRCGKYFPDRYARKVHSKAHEDEKSFKCSQCSYTSKTLRYIKSHLLTHTDEKPYSCDHCDQAFRQKQILRRHQNTCHTPNYEPKPPKEKDHGCHVCKRSFAHKGYLMRHLATHDPDFGQLQRALNPSREGKVANADALTVGVSSPPKRDELVTVSAGDQQYVVLEILQLESGNELRVAPVAPDFLQATTMPEEDKNDDVDDTEDRKLELMLQQQLVIDRMKTDVGTCFGFDEVNEEEEKEELATT